MVRVLIAICLSANAVCAQELPADYPGRAQLDDRLGAFDSELQANFERALGDFDRQIETRPYDIALKVERCRFIDELAYQFEYSAWIDTVFDRSDACAAELEASWPTHPEVVLRRFDYLYGETLLEAALPYDYPPNRPGWTEGQLARLYERLAVAADVMQRPDAGAFAKRAVELDAQSSVRVIAAESLAADGQREQALAMLLSPLVDRDPVDDPWNSTREMALLASLGERQRLIELYEGLRDQAEYFDSTAAARALRAAGEFERAREEFASAAEFNVFDTDLMYEWLHFELETGSAADARAAYDRWRDTGWSADPLGINRFALFLRDPSLQLRARDLLGLLGFVLVTLAIGLAAAAAVAPVHYRGAVRRARGQLTVDPAGWQLRHAWYVLFAMGLASVASLYAIGAINLAPMVETNWFVVAATDQLARYFLVDALLFIAFLLPVCRVAVSARPSWATVSWSIPKCLLIAVGIALAFRVPFFLYLAAGAQDANAQLVSNSPIWQMISAVREQYGTFLALWLVAIVAPAVEETTFRGVLLNSFSKHVSFGWANAFQAGLFAMIHFDLSATPLLFALGFVAGLLARRSGGLLAPIALHAVFNFIVGVSVLIPGPA